MINKDINYYKKSATYYKAAAQRYKLKAQKYDVDRKHISNGTKKGIELARRKGKQIGARTKYSILQGYVQYAICRFWKRKTIAKQNHVPVHIVISTISQQSKIPVSTLYRLARVWQGLPFNPAQTFKEEKQALIARQQQLIYQCRRQKEAESQWYANHHPDAPLR